MSWSGFNRMPMFRQGATSAIARCFINQGLGLQAQASQIPAGFGTILRSSGMAALSAVFNLPTSPPGSTRTYATSASTADSGPLPRQDLSKMPTFGEVAFEDHDFRPDGLSSKDLSLVQLYIAGCNHYWNMLPGLAEQSMAQGATNAEVWSTIRHLIVFAGYAPCLAATITLRQKGVLQDPSPGKVGGEPGDAFELVYDKVTDAVRAKLHHWDPVLSEYIRVHLYGDVYSSPGLTMAQKQLCTVAFLGEANMHDQLYTHLIAAMRFGNSRSACETAIKVGFHMSPRPSIVLRPIIRGAMRSLEQAYQKAQKAQAEPPPPGGPQVTIPNPESVKIPPLPPKTQPPKAE